MDVKIKPTFIDEAVSLIFCVLIFLTLRPYFIWQNNFIYVTIFILAVTFSLVWIFLKMRISKKSLFYLSIFLSSFALSQFTLHGIYLWISAMVVLISFFVLFDEKIHQTSLSYFINIYAIVSIPSILIFFLLVTGVNLEWEHLEPYSKAKQSSGVYYREYLGMVVLSTQIFTFGTGEIFRLSSVFTEPGVVGTVSALLLAVTRFDIRNWKGMILLISGMLSFTLAFYILAFIYLGLKKPFYLLISVGLLSTLIVLLPSDIKDNRIIQYYVMERSEALLVNFDKVNNRVDECFEQHYDEFLSSTNIYFGNGYKASISLKCNTSSYKTIIYDYGTIGFLMIVLFYITIFISKISTKSDVINCIPFLIIFFATAYQRPAFDTFWFFAIFIGGINSIINFKSNISDSVNSPKINSSLR